MLYIVVWKSDGYTLAVNRGFDSAELAEQYVLGRTKICLHNINIRPLEVINCSLVDIPKEEAAAPL